VFLSSVAGKAAFPFLSAYVATKFALEGLCDSMRREAGPQGVKIIAIQPGAIRTNLIQQQIADVSRSYATLGEEEHRRYGHFYQGFLKTADVSMAETASSPEQIAAVVIEALDAEEPATRYAAGADAGPVLEMTRTSSDRQIDAMFAQMFSV
jgi:NAD(P)-dependent dehydrogenase (short-subunit alcohol dehydrogenase family)